MKMEEFTRQWVKERDEATLSFDVDKFKAFFEKWKKLGVYDGDLPPDEVIEVSIRKMVIYMAHPPKDKLEEAKEWLQARGYSADD